MFSNLLFKILVLCKPWTFQCNSFVPWKSEIVSSEHVSGFLRTSWLTQGFFPLCCSRSDGGQIENHGYGKILVSPGWCAERVSCFWSRLRFRSILPLSEKVHIPIRLQNSPRFAIKLFYVYCVVCRITVVFQGDNILHRFDDVYVALYTVSFH